MKRSIFILPLVLMLAFVLYAPQATSRSLELKGIVTLQEDKVKIKMEELPQAARKTLSGDAYKGWTVGEVFRTKAGDYEVELKKDDAIQVLKFDRAGKVK
jgi:hypothetical protein